jgi:integrase
MRHVRRKPPSQRLGTAESRAALKIQAEPYWATITPGTALGYYKGERDRSWFVRQRSGGKYVKARIGTPDDFAAADGQVVLSHSQAVNKAVSVQVEGRTPSPRHYADGVTLNQVMEAYIAEHLSGRGSQRFTQLTWKQHIKEDIGTKLVSAVDDAALRKWLKALVAKAPTLRAPNGERKADPRFDATQPEQQRARKASANRTLTMVKAALNWGRAKKLIPAEVPTWWRDVPSLPLGQEPEPRMLDTTEVARLLNAAPKDLRTLLNGALMTGARRGELVSLQCRAYDSETGTLRIYQSKTGKTLTQPLTSEGVALFDSLTAGRNPKDPIFLREDGRPWAVDDVTKPMAKAVAAAKLKDVSLKTMRATYGKLLLLATKDIELVAKALGHSDSRVTRKHYARYLTDDLARGIAQMPALGIVVDHKVARIGGKRK